MEDVIADVRGGFSVNCEDRPASLGEFGVLKTGAVINGIFRPEENKAVLPKEVGRTRTAVAADTIIICRKNSEDVIGASALVEADFPNLYLSDLLWQITPKQNISKHWLAAVLASERVRSLIRISSSGTQPSMKNISQDRLLAIPVTLPPLPDQVRIAEILGEWDEAIKKLEQLREAKERRHRALTYSLVFGKRQFGRFRTTDGVTPHRWFTLPKSWDCKLIGKLAGEISERNVDGGAYEVLSCSKYEGFVRSLEYFKKQVFSADLSGYKKIWRGDFGFPSNHVEEGSIGLQNITDVGVVSPIYTVFRFASDTVNADYAFAVLKTGLYRHIFEVSTSASVDRRGSLRWNEFSKLPFPVPSLAEQTAIAEVLQTAQAELNILTTEINLLIGQKRGLMQKLLTGAWRVNLEEQQ
ncbi:restriction endonuclease subunit S [Sinorhizobium meliloti]